MPEERHRESMDGGISVRVNGEALVTRPGSLLDLLRALDLDPRTVVVERNRQIVRRPALGETPLQDGDELELVHFVGGG